jgi:alcohol dehydrogenase
MKIRAAVLTAIGAKPPFAQTKPLVIEEVELAGPGHGEVLVKIATAGLASFRSSVINGDRPRPMPMAAGARRPASSKSWRRRERPKRGDHVVLVFVPSCGHCRHAPKGGPRYANRAPPPTPRTLSGRAA